MERRPHPVDEFGLAVRPEDISLECDPEACRQAEPFTDRQHVYHPGSEFSKGELKKLRNCGRFVVRNICRCMHEKWDNEYDPPPQPDREVLRSFNAGELAIKPTDLL